MISKAIVIGWTLFLVYSFMGGMSDVSDGAASSSVLGLVMILSAFVHFGLWCAIAVPAILISRMFRKRPA